MTERTKELLDRWMIDGAEVTIRGPGGAISFRAVLAEYRLVEPNPLSEPGYLWVNLQSSGPVAQDRRN